MTVDAAATHATEAEYVDGCELLAHLARTIRLLRLTEMRNFNERAQTLAPILEPTTFMRGGSNNLRHQQLLIDAFSEVQRVVERIASESR